MNIAVASGKGGTGKTTVAVNLAVRLSDKFKTVLVDLDVEEPDSALFFNADNIGSETVYKMIPEWKEESCTLCDICSTVCNFNALIRMPSSILVFENLCHSCYACSELCPVSALPMKEIRTGVINKYVSDKLQIIEGKLDIGEEQAVPLIARVKKYVADKLQDSKLNIFDSPPGTSCPFVEATKDVDMVILVTEPTPFGLNDLDLAVKTLRKTGKDMKVVINKHVPGNETIDKYCLDNEIEIIGRIPLDRLIAEKYSRGELLDDVQGFKDIEKWFERILD